MPILEFKCEECLATTEQFFKTISQGEMVDQIQCSSCGGPALKAPSVPLGFGLYGDPAGYSKPSATKRYSTKTVSKFEGNSSSAG